MERIKEMKNIRFIPALLLGAALRFTTGCATAQAPDPCSAESLESTLAMCKLGIREAVEAGNDDLANTIRAACLEAVDAWGSCDQ